MSAERDMQYLLEPFFRAPRLAGAATSALSQTVRPFGPTKPASAADCQSQPLDFSNDLRTFTLIDLARRATLPERKEIGPRALRNPRPHGSMPPGRGGSLGKMAPFGLRELSLTTLMI